MYAFVTLPVPQAVIWLPLVASLASASVGLVAVHILNILLAFQLRRILDHHLSLHNAEGRGSEGESQPAFIGDNDHTQV